MRDLDEAIRTLRRETRFPWVAKKTTLRVFQGVLEYPVQPDHDRIAYIDNKLKTFDQKANFRYTSLKEFYEDPNNRNDLAEIWDTGVRYLGCRYKTQNASSLTFDTAASVSGITLAGDAVSVALDDVFFDTGTSSIRVSVVENIDSATIKTVLPTLATALTDYRRYYYFREVYLDSVPTSLELQCGTDSGNYLKSTVTTQFSGQPFVANDWNVVAFDLNTATEVGTLNPQNFDYNGIVINGVSTGNYYLGQSYLRQWELLNFWYYSTRNVITIGSSVANQDYFFNDSEIYSTDSQLVGDTNWSDVCMYDALLTSVADKENDKVQATIQKKRDDAWTSLLMVYPEMATLITTSKWNFSFNATPTADLGGPRIITNG